MKIRLTFSFKNDVITLPLHHNHLIQAMLYKNLPPALSSYLHNIGFFHEKRKFKLFTFSKLFSPRFIIQNKKIIHTKPLTLYIGSAMEDIAKNWGNIFLKSDAVYIGENTLYLESIEILPKINVKEEFVVKTLSPIAVKRTFEKNGKKDYRFYTPKDGEFSELIKRNIIKKYTILTGKEPENFYFRIEPIDKFRIAPIKYKNFTVRGVEGKFYIKTDPTVFTMVCDAGLGVQNSQGFGMVEVLKWKKLK